MFELFLAEFRRAWHLYRRYPGEVAAGIAAMTLAFLALLAGGVYIAGPALGPSGGDRIDGLIIGYALWSLVMFVMADGAGMIQREAVAGTLEQLYLSPYGAVRIVVTRSFAGLMLHVAVMLIVFGVLLGLTGRRVDVSPAVLAPFATVVAATLGISLTFGGLALVLKRVDQLMNLARFFLLVPVMFPADVTSVAARTVASLLPMAPGSMIVRRMMVSGGSADPVFLIVAAVNGAAYFVVGLLVFNAADRYARRRALIGQH